MNWQSLTKREKGASVGAGVVILIWLYWTQVYSPLQESSDRLKANIQITEQVATQLENYRAIMIPATSSGDMSADELAELLRQKFQSSLAGIATNSDGTLSVSLSAHRFESLLEILLTLRNQHKIVVTYADIKAIDQGNVTAELKLRH